MDNNTEWYRVFYWTAKLGSLTKAAERLHITQPAVSHTLKQLEASFEGPLFFRSTRGVSLTTEGEALYRFVEQAFRMLELGEKTIAEMRSLRYGEISIGASDTLCKHFLLPKLERFHSEYPDIRIRVTNRTTPETIALLKEGVIDFGIVNLPIEDEKLELLACAVLQECLVGGAQYAELAENPFHLEQLRQYPMLLLEQGSSTRRFLDDFATANDIELQPDFELGSIDLLVEFAARGFGLMFVARSYIEKELASGQLVELPLVPYPPARHVGIATLRGVPLSAASKQFLNDWEKTSS